MFLKFMEKMWMENTKKLAGNAYILRRNRNVGISR